jgi:energy-coupling factor transport system substrate-specific component
MTWEVASFLIVAAVILGGFAWYERSRPPAQVVALVAALAALAIAGRIAFAAFPNVKPTTDIVIFAGYALGGAPGFAVGALAALVSNFWFGQGPWTPWQMAGWGLCGVLGAAVALGARNAGRLTLAATCAFAGIFYGALMNFSLMATYGGDLSLRHFLVLEARAIPFEVAHVVGNVALALVAGPAMVRMLVRFRERFEWERRGPGEPQSSRRLRPLRGGGIAAILLVLALVACAPASAEANSVTRAADWLETQQRPSGGFGSDTGREAGAEMTGWAMLGLAAAGRNPNDVTNLGKSPVDFLRNHLSELGDAGDVARTILALDAAGVDTRDFGGQNLVTRLLAQRKRNGSYQRWPATSAYAVLALRAVDAEAAATKTVEWLRKVQGKDGSWGNLPRQEGTPEITGAVLQVLSPGSEAADRALAYIREEKRPNGAYAPGRNLAANTPATSWAAQGLLSVGEDPAAFGPGKSPFAYMREMQAEDGYFLKEPGMDIDRIWVTADVLVALSGHHLPVPAPPREPKPKTPKPTDADTSSTSGSGGLTLPAPETGESSATSPQEVEEAFDKFDGESSAGGPAGGGTGSGPGPGAVPPATGKVPGTVPDYFSEEGLPEDAPGSTAEVTPLQEGEQASETNDSSGSTAGAILLGLLAGCVLFAMGLGGRRGWMRWRYGL